MSDLISRQAAIDALIERDPNCGINSAEVIKGLPSAEPERIACVKVKLSKEEIQEAVDDAVKKMMAEMAEPEPRKKGKWIPHEGGKFVGFPYMHYECSECRAFEPTETNFCPNCGSYNGGEQE